MFPSTDRKSTRLNSSHTEIYTLSLHDALPICAKSVGAESLYVAMFDEIDEGTAIYKVSNEDKVPLNGDSGLKFVGVEKDLPTDYYLWLIGQGASWFHGEGNYDTAKPVRE